MARLFLLFLVVPIVELTLLLRVGEMIGLWPTIALIVGTALVGSRLAAGQGLSVWRSVESALSAGRLPGAELVDGLIVLLSGALLLTPGLLTDVVGLLGLFPLSRPLIRNYVLARMSRAAAAGQISVSFSGPGPNPGPPASRGNPSPPQGTRRTDPTGEPPAQSTVSGAATPRPTFDPR